MMRQDTSAGARHKGLLRGLPFMAAVLLLAGCMQAPDLRAVQAERSKPLHRFDFLHTVASNGRVLVAAGAGGALLRSTDGGQHWQREQLAQPAALVDVSVCPDGSFVGVDFYRKVWFADAQAQNWTARALGAQAQGLAVTCAADARVWVVGANSAILSSTDRGLNWTDQSLGEDAMLATVQFTDERHAVITGEFGLVLTSDDAGATWKKQAVSRADFYPYSTVFVDAQRGWSVGVAGVILHTEDGAQTWSEQPNDSGAVLYRLAVHEGRVLGVGTGGTVAQLQGQRWQRMPYENPALAFLTAVAPVDKQSVAVAGVGGVLQSVVVASTQAHSPSNQNK